MRISEIYLISLASGLGDSVCVALSKIALALNINTIQPQIMNQLNGSIDCCNAYGIKCSYSSSFLGIKIDWSQLNLTGYILAPDKFPYFSKEAIDGITLNFASNSLSGAAPAFHSNVKHLDLSSNYYTAVYENQLNMFQFNISNNRIAGTFSMAYPREFDISSNYITDLQILSTSYIKTCDISNNPLLGHPILSRLTMCKQDGLYSPSLLPYSGPETTEISTSVTLTTSLVDDTLSELTSSTEHKTHIQATTLSSVYYSFSKHSGMLSTSLYTSNMQTTRNATTWSMNLMNQNKKSGTASRIVNFWLMLVMAM